MRVGINSLFLIPGQVGGSETYLCETLLRLAQHHGQVKWIVFCNRENYPHFCSLFDGQSAVELRRLFCPARFRPARILWEQLALPHAVRRAHVDVLWSPGYTAPLRTPCPQVVSVLDMQYREFPQDLSPLARWVTHRLVPAAVHRAARVITLSAFAKQQIVRYTEVTPDRVQIVYPGVDPEFARSLTSEELRSRLSPYGLGEVPSVLCVANTYPHKNVPTLIEAFGRVVAGTPHRLVLVGLPGRGEAQVRAAIRRLPDPGRVLRLCNVARPTLIALYQAARVFVLPSLYEGFGLPVLEAMAAGVPVITTTRASLPEIGGDAVNYFDGTVDGLVPVLRRILASDAAARLEQARAGQDRAATFSWEHAAERLVRCLEGLVPPAGRAEKSGALRR